MSASLSRLRAMLRRWLRGTRESERALDEEIASVLQHEIDARIADGLSPAEAARVARAAFGRVEPIKEHVRDARTGAFIESLARDVRYAWRGIQRSPGSSLAVIGSLAIGLAVTVAVTAFIHALMAGGYPGVTDQQRLVGVRVIRTASGEPTEYVMRSEADYLALRAGLDGLQGLTAFSDAAVTVALPEPRALTACLVSANYFDVFGARPILGRAFGSDEDRPEHAAVAVISSRVWRQDFAGDPAVIGRAIRVADAYVTIVGVAPEGFGGTTPGRVDIWLPSAMGDRVAPDSTLPGRERGLTFVGRLKDGVSTEQIRTAAETIATQRLATEGIAGQRARASTSDVAWIDRTDRSDVILPIMPIPLLVLTIACVNASTLLLARGARRRHEITIRLAIGAGRGRVVRGLVVESGVLALLAAAVGLLLAWWTTQIVGRELSIAMPIDATVLVSTLLVTAICAIASGLVPALRITAHAPLGAWRGLDADTDGGRGAWRGRWLIVAQIALSIGVLATVTQLVALVASQRGSAGTPADRLLMASFDLDQLRFTPDSADRFYAELAERASRLPNVERVGVAHKTAVWILGGPVTPVVVWQPGATAKELALVLGGYAGADLFGAVGLRLLQGRAFVPADRDGPPRVAVVNEAYAKRTQGPVLGRTLRVGVAERDGHIDDEAFAAGRDVRIVGVIQSASDPRYSLDGKDGSVVPRIYLPAPLRPEPALTLYLRTRTSAETVAAPLRELVHAIDPRVPILEIGSLEAWNARSRGWVPSLMRAATVMGLLALVLTATGLLAVVSYAVSLRTREFAIRMALGSHPRGVLALVLRQAMRIVAIGVVIGASLALLATKLLQTQFRGVQRLDITAFAGSCALLIVVMLLASAAPAIRAARVDPVAALKEG
jgi:predicted permease